jgi:hypothetical protein
MPKEKKKTTKPQKRKLPIAMIIMKGPKSKGNKGPCK